MPNLDLSVHQIVDFLLRSGDIDDRYFNATSMNEGSKLHAIYQAKQGLNYLSEYFLKHTFIIDDYTINVEGRADGIIIGEIPTIDEIKTTTMDLDEFFKQNEIWHLGQAEFYAYIYLTLTNSNKCLISLTYIHQNSNKELKKIYEYSIDELKTIVYSYLTQYINFHKILIEKQIAKNISLKNLKFPFLNIRNGQNELIEETYNSFKNHDVVFCEAATGSGKTISTIYGSLKAMKEERLDKIFYITPKNSGFLACIDTIKLFRDQNIQLISTQITSREKICLNKKKIGECNPDDCPFAKKYYDKVKDVIFKTLSEHDVLDKKTISEIAKKNNLCPFEFSLDLSSYSDFIISDYNYVFDPISKLKRFFENPDKQYKMGLLIDEAHNMVDRSINMYSSEFYSDAFKKCKDDIDDKCNKSLKERAEKVRRYIKIYEDSTFDKDNVLIIDNFIPDFIFQLKTLDTDIKKYKETHHKFKSKNVDDFMIDIYRFLYLYNLYEDDVSRFKVYIKKINDEKVSFNIRCLDPSKYINDSLRMFEGSAFFSATLSPIDYFTNSIIGRDNVKKIKLSSPYNHNNLKVLVNKGISLLYKDREFTLPTVIDQINMFIEKRVGNYMVFLPSFQYLDALRDKFFNSKVRTLFQSKDMTNDEKEMFLDCFKENNNETTIGFGVLGGTFSEGIDLVGDRLIGVIVVGIGLPSISFENDIRKEYYDSKGLNGFEYAYFNVGMNKVTQAVGRLIRSENDKGAVLLIDKRYKYKNYNELFNGLWANNAEVNSIEEIDAKLDQFYDSIN